MITIYGLVDPRDGAVRYVGQTKCPGARRYQHIFRSHSPRIRAWVEELKALAIEPAFHVLAGARSRTGATRTEYALMRKHRETVLNTVPDGPAKRRPYVGKPAHAHKVRATLTLHRHEFEWLEGWAREREVTLGNLVVEALGALENHWPAWSGRHA
jgi:hypothetical protein